MFPQIQSQFTNDMKIDKHICDFLHGSFSNTKKALI